MSFDSLAPESWDGDVLARLAELREHDPVHRDERNGLWVVTRHEDVAHVSLHPEIFCSGQGTRPNVALPISILDMDDPRHGALRALVGRGFTPRRVATLERAFRARVVERLAALGERGECDLVAALARPLPLALIADVIGLPEGDHARLAHWSDALVDAEGREDEPEAVLAGATATVEFVASVEALYAARRAEPRDDLVSVLVHAHDEARLEAAPASERAVALLGDAAAIGADELNMFMILLLVAGNETTRNAITGGLLALMERPEALARLVREPALVESTTEEILRWVSPVLSMARTVTEPTELRGVRLEQGDKVLMVYPAANHDPRVFDAPDAFRVDRTPNPHLAFGVGRHFCLGASLARMELRVLLEELLPRIRRLEAATDGPRMRSSALVRSYAELHVRYELRTP